MSAPSIQDRRQMLRDDVCFVCRQHVTERESTYHAHLGIITHSDCCSEFVSQFERDYSQSKRGRWRRPAAVLQLVEENRHQFCTASDNTRCAPCPSGCGGNQLRVEDPDTRRVQCCRCGWRAVITEDGTAKDWQPGWRKRCP